MSVEVAVERPRVGNRVQPVERVRDVDDPVLLADRRHGVGEREAARDLLAARKRPITSPWPSVFTSSPGITIRSRPSRVVDGLERAAEDVVVRDRDRAEPLRLGVVDELGGIGRAVVRPRRVHVQVGDDPRPVGERLRLAAPRATARSRVSVELVELRGDGGERLRLGTPARGRPVALAQRRVVGEACRGGRGELGLRLDALTAARSRSPRRPPRASPGAGRRSPARRSRPR